jgi:glyoxylase-like metal-dependent hydrolase (beta-lactamase superfamily II)
MVSDRPTIIERHFIWIFASLTMEFPIKKMFLAGIAALALSGMKAPASEAATPLSLWRLDCGGVDVKDLGTFSDTGLYAGTKRRLTASCYLIRNGDRFLLWDTGIDGKRVGQGPDANGNFVDVTIIAQLARIGVAPADITFVGISHVHQDHTGQVADFANATLLIGKGDWEIARSWKPARDRLSHWLDGGGKSEPLEDDKDVFGDGRVTILRMPGHTPGHQVLLVRLASGPVLISGDQFHFTENRKVGGVPSFNMDRAATLASHDRFEKLATNLRAKVIIQHEPDDIAKLPVFPKAAR